METTTAIALAVGIPVILLPVALVWYVNVSGVYAVIKETRNRRIAHEKRGRAGVEVG
jgi:hypothetical protein